MTREFEAARAICRRHARSFYFASRFLPPEKRYAAYAVYAFCRGIDDAVDTGDPATVDLRLAAFRDRLAGIYAGDASTDAAILSTEQQLALRAFAETVTRYEIPQAYFLDLAEGCKMDLVVTRYATWADLERYCYLVAGVVGLVMSRVFGLTDRAAETQAVTMGNAMQLTNILRDVGEDWQRGRLYLPAEDLARFAVTEADIAAGQVTDGFAALMRFESARAVTLFELGAAGLPKLANDGSRLTACAMAVTYSGILGAIRRQNYDVFTRRARVPTLGKLARIPRARRLARGASPLGMFG